MKLFFLGFTLGLLASVMAPLPSGGGDGGLPRRLIDPRQEAPPAPHSPGNQTAPQVTILYSGLLPSPSAPVGNSQGQATSWTSTNAVVNRWASPASTRHFNYSFRLTWTDATGTVSYNIPTIRFNWTNREDRNHAYWRYAHTSAQRQNQVGIYDILSLQGAGFDAFQHTFQTAFLGPGPFQTRRIWGWSRFVTWNYSFQTRTLTFGSLIPGWFEIPRSLHEIRAMADIWRNHHTLLHNTIQHEMRTNPAYAKDYWLGQIIPSVNGSGIPAPSGRDPVYNMLQFDWGITEPTDWLRERLSPAELQEYYRQHRREPINIAPFMFLHSNPQFRADAAWLPDTPEDVRRLPLVNANGTMRQRFIAPPLARAQVLDDLRPDFGNIRLLIPRDEHQVLQPNGSTRGNGDALAFNQLQALVRDRSNRKKQQAKKDAEDLEKLNQMSQLSAAQLNAIMEMFQDRRNEQTAQDETMERLTRIYDDFMQDVPQPDDNEQLRQEVMGEHHTLPAIFCPNGPVYWTARGRRFYVYKDDIELLWTRMFGEEGKTWDTLDDHKKQTLQKLWKDFHSGDVNYNSLCDTMDQIVPEPEPAEPPAAGRGGPAKRGGGRVGRPPNPKPGQPARAAAGVRTRDHPATAPDVAVDPQSTERNVKQKTDDSAQILTGQTEPASDDEGGRGGHYYAP